MTNTQSKTDGVTQVHSSSYPHLQNNPDEIRVLEYIYTLVKHKWRIIGFTLLGIIAGDVIALIKGPTWISEVIIAPKESNMQTTPNLSGLGAFGGIVASQLNITGNPGLDKIELILDSRKFHAEVIEKNTRIRFCF